VSEIFEERDEAPSLEVRVLREGEVIHRELCESEEQAALVVARWAEVDGVEWEVGDLVEHTPIEGVLEPEPAEIRDADYPEVLESEPRGWSGED
jgi:hypothetical protein